MMTKDEALEFVREYFARHGLLSSDGKGIIESDGRDIIRFKMMIESGVRYEMEGEVPPTLEEALALGDDGPRLRPIHTAETIEPLLELAETDRLAHKAACEVAAELLERGETLPPSLSVFAAKALLGTNLPKGKRSSDPREDLLRNWLFVGAVFRLQGKGVTATLNASTRDKYPEKICGCGIVAEVSNKSYSAIETVWKNRPRP
jgi:hypothetical protein